jgi:glycosyltransferase involved in cell wall biosynthesis
MKLSIIIPLFNEERSIFLVLEKIISLTFPTYITDFEIIIIDDCSTDSSFDCAQKYAKEHPCIRLFQQDKNRGKGAAVKRGFYESTGDIMLIQDADLELDPADIPIMLHTMQSLKVELVNGSRYLPGIIRPVGSYRRYFGNKIFTILTSMLINVHITDLACGYKLIHKTLLDKLMLRENRFGFEAELIIKALRIKKNNIAEVPVQYFPRNLGEGKKLKRWDAIKVLWTITKYGLLRLN